MSQLLVTTADSHGRFVTINRLSDGAESAGLTTSDVIGRQMWDFAEPTTAKIAESRFAECVIHGREVEFHVTSELGGHVEQWHTTLIPSPGAAVLAISRHLDASDIRPILEEVVIVRMLANDLLVSEIAAKLDVPEGTLAVRLKRLRDRLNIRTNHGLVAKFIDDGLI